MEIDKEKIVQKLNEKNATKPCHRCGQNSFSVLDGFSKITIQKKFSAGLIIDGEIVPVVHIACNICGALTPHALGALDMLPDEEAQNGE